MQSRYDFKMIKQDIQGFEKKFEAIQDEDPAKAAVLYASMENYFRTLADSAKSNFENFMQVAVKKIGE